MDAGRRLSPLAREKILYYHHKGLSGPKIVEQLRVCKQIITTRQTVTRFLIRNKSKNANTETRKQKQKVTDSHGKFIDFWIATNPNINSRELKEKFEETFGVSVSDSLMRKVRRKLGWQTRTNIQYCQLITNVNKKKRLEYSLNALGNREDFKNVIFVDESSVEMSSSGKMYFYKNGSCFDRLPTKAPKPKHAYKVHVWAGISYQGRTNLCIFSGVMDSVIYQGILQDNLLPFVNMRFPDGYRLYQDNDRKHTSKSTQEWMSENNMLENVMTVPPSSPDLNPIENVWAAMKDYLQRNVKPKKKEELITGIRTFWESLTPQHCARYIDHVHKVIPHVVLNMGGPTQF